VNISIVKVKSSFGHEIHNPLFAHEPASDHLTALFPGVNNTYESPLLFYARKVALQAGSDTLGIEYGYRRSGHALSTEAYKPTLEETIEALRLCEIEKYRSVSFISKSFGTIVAGEAARYFKTVNIRNMFLTPVASTIPYISDNACIVVYGTADPNFSQSHAAKISDNPSVKLLAIPGADHSLEIENDYRASLRILEQICENYGMFLGSEK